MATRRTQQEIRPSLVPPPVAGLASLLVPGLGQALARLEYENLDEAVDTIREIVKGRGGIPKKINPEEREKAGSP